MFEERLLELLVYLAGGWLGFRYGESFLSLKWDSRARAASVWLLAYGAGQMGVSLLLEQLPWMLQSIYGSMMSLLAGALLMVALQRLCFAGELSRQVFLLLSFWAGWGILRFAVSPLAHVLFDWWNPLWQYLAEEGLARGLLSADWLLANLQEISRLTLFSVLLVCRLVQLGLFALYLRLIAESFPKPYKLKQQESLFLLTPCLAVLAIDLTLRVMAYSVDNSALMLIYDRAPEILLLLPMVSLLLLGLVVSAVFLFRGLVQFKEEEQKRLLLEKSVADVHRQVRELEDIYGEIRGLRHDLRGHIGNLIAYVKQHLPQEREELEPYLAGMERTVAGLDFADKTGHPITDIILHQARQQAKKRGLHFRADFHYPPGKDFDVYDISVMLNNALENATEACGQVPRGEIEVRSYMRGNLYFLEVVNDFAGELKGGEGTDLPATTKEDGRHHGLGLANIARCAEKYQGTVDIGTETKEGRQKFRLVVMLYQRSD